MSKAKQLDIALKELAKITWQRDCWRDKALSFEKTFRKLDRALETQKRFV